MASFRSLRSAQLLLLVLLACIVFSATAQLDLPRLESTPFDKEYRVIWGDNLTHKNDDGGVSCSMDASGGSGYTSKNKFTFGYVSTSIKLVPGDSSGIVTAYYLSSEQDTNATMKSHDELDFEFLGNSSGEPYIVQTNVFADGIGEREQRIYLWFDPTTDYHDYALLWNPSIILFLVDGVPIRIFKNLKNLGVGFPSTRPMGISSSIWNGENWATRGGRQKIDWSYSPFTVSFKNFTLDACQTDPEVLESDGKTPILCDTLDKWWGTPEFQEIGYYIRYQVDKVKSKYMIYDYCTDYERYPVTPPECAVN